MHSHIPLIGYRSAARRALISGTVNAGTAGLGSDRLTNSSEDVGSACDGDAPIQVSRAKKRALTRARLSIFFPEPAVYIRRRRRACLGQHGAVGRQARAQLEGWAPSL